MTPEQQAIIKALLAGGMPQGDMQGASPLRQRAMMADAQRAQQGRADAFYDAQPRPGYAGAGLGGMAGEPFDPREALSAPAQPQMPSGYASVFSDLTPEEQAGIAQAMRQGLPVADAFNAVLGVDMNAITRGR